MERKEIEVLWDHQEKKAKQGIMGPAGHKGDPGLKGQKGDTGPAGMMPGTKGDPGESISAPVVAVSPSKLTLNESGTASISMFSER